MCFILFILSKNSTIEMVRAIAFLVLVLCLSYAAAVNAHEEVTESGERRGSGNLVKLTAIK